MYEEARELPQSTNTVEVCLTSPRHRASVWRPSFIHFHLAIPLAYQDNVSLVNTPVIDLTVVRDKVSFEGMAIMSRS